MSAGFQIRATGTIAVVHRYSRRQEVSILGFEIYEFSILELNQEYSHITTFSFHPPFPIYPKIQLRAMTKPLPKGVGEAGVGDASHQRVKHPWFRANKPKLRHICTLRHMFAIDKEESLWCFMKRSLLKTGATGALWPAHLFPVDTGSQHYLDTHNASSPTAVLALGHSLIAVA